MSFVNRKAIIQIDKISKRHSLSNDTMPFELCVDFELDESNQDCYTNARNHDIKHVLEECGERENAHHLEYNKKVCFISRAYSKVKNIPPGTYSTKSLQSQSGPLVMKLQQRGHSIQKILMRHIGSYTHTFQMER